MLINLHDLIKKYNITIKGILHVGAHECEELIEYLQYAQMNKILWVEAMPNKVDFCKKKYPTIFIETAVISDKIENVTFNVSNNGQSSSILKLDKHKIHHPHIHVSEVINVNSKRMDTLLSENNINIDDYDFLNIDIQGAELLALKGFGDLLNNIKYIYTEINTNTLYKDCALVSEIDEYLSNYEFKRVETYMTDFEWGDALYIKN